MILAKRLPPRSLNAELRKSREQMKKYRLAKIKTMRIIVHTTRRNLPFVSKSTKNIETSSNFLGWVGRWGVGGSEFQYFFKFCHIPFQGVPVSWSSGHAHGSSGSAGAASFGKEIISWFGHHYQITLTKSRQFACHSPLAAITSLNFFVCLIALCM